jgi:hypothetical protein
MMFPLLVLISVFSLAHQAERHEEQLQALLQQGSRRHEPVDALAQHADDYLRDLMDVWSR